MAKDVRMNASVEAARILFHEICEAYESGKFTRIGSIRDGFANYVSTVARARGEKDVTAEEAEFSGALSG